MLKSIKKTERRESAVRTQLLERLKFTVQSLLHGGDGVLHVSSGSPRGPILGHTDNTNSLCNVIEAIFIHGLKDGLGQKFASIFISDVDRMPAPNFWPVIMTISHRDLMEQVSSQSFITNDVGRGRSWLRLALNQGQLISYLPVLAADVHTLKDYYRTTAFFRDLEICDMMIRIVQPLGSASFNFATNAAILNTWTQTPLILAGVCMPAKYDYMVDPILPATDVASTLDCVAATETATIPISPSHLSEEMFDIIIRGTPEMLLEENLHESDTVTQTEAESSLIHAASSLCVTALPKVDEQQIDEISNITKEPEEKEIPTRNSRLISVGEETIFNRSISTVIDESEYQNLFSEFDVPHQGGNLPSFLTQLTQTPAVYSERKQSLEQLAEVEKEFEVISTHFSADYHMDSLLPLYIVLTNEEGLDVQNFLCYSPNCSTHIGLIYGRPRLCKYENKYYCYECHQGDVSVIPARIINNWDFTLHSVCTMCKEWLDSVSILPLINLRLANLKLYRHVENLAELQMLRIQLYYIQAYLFSCKLDKGKALRKKFWPREHLYEHVHLFSMLDLQQVFTGKLVPLLRQAVTCGKQHVLHCAICAPRGFICEVCKETKIIYPFQLGETYTCSVCCGVYHIMCVSRPMDCPKCKRTMRNKGDTVDDSIL